MAARISTTILSRVGAGRSLNVLSQASRTNGVIGTRFLAHTSLKAIDQSSYQKKSENNYYSKITAAAALGGALLVGLNSDSELKAETVNYEAVRKDIENLLDADDYDDGSYGPVLVRLAWHLSGTYSQWDRSGGSDGCFIRFPPECDYGANAGLDVARDLLEPIKKKYPAISYADLYTLAGVVAIEAMGGPKIPWREGRSDAPKTSKGTPDGRLPDAARKEDHVRAIFYRMGFNDQEIVALLGAHCLGRCHPSRSGYDGPWTNAPTTFSNEYFVKLLEEKWVKKKWNGPEQMENEGGRNLMMLPADMCLVEDREFREWVEIYAKDEKRFFKDFAAAFQKLEELGTKHSGEKKGWWFWS